jgi:hypothetical protein
MIRSYDHEGVSDKFGISSGGANRTTVAKNGMSNIAKLKQLFVIDLFRPGHGPNTLYNTIEYNHIFRSETTCSFLKCRYTYFKLQSLIQIILMIYNSTFIFILQSNTPNQQIHTKKASQPAILIQTHKQFSRSHGIK